MINHINTLKHGIFCTLIIGLISCASVTDTDYHYSDTPPDLADEDHDGVINERDICPDTTPNATVTYKGCPLWKELDNVKEAVIFFETGSSNVHINHIEDIRMIIDHVENTPEARIVIEGFTSLTGSKQINEKLQHDRSNAVKALLIQEGATSENIHIHKQGEKTLHVSDEHQAANAVNQRVYIHAVKPEKNVQIKWNVHGGNNVK